MTYRRASNAWAVQACRRTSKRPCLPLALLVLVGSPLLIGLMASAFVTETGASGRMPFQSTAVLQGRVVDQNRAVVPGAQVSVQNSATGLARKGETDSEGNYQIAALPVGTYSVEVTARGFRTEIVERLGIEVARIVVQDFRLEVGDITQTINVTPEAGLIELATVSVGQVVDQRTVQELPLNGRHFIDLGLLVPGSVTPPQNGTLSPPARGQGSFALNTAGNREDTVNYQINGINLNDQINNIITFLPPISSIQEFKFDNSTFSAEYGRNSGGIVNIATRRGANQFHGELMEYFRNDALDARNFFNFTSSRPPPFKRNQFGAELQRSHLCTEPDLFRQWHCRRPPT